MITSLTKEQKAKFPEYVERYIAKGLRIGATDRERFERGIRACYRNASLEDVPIIFVSSPIVGAFAAPIAANVIHILKTRIGSAVGLAVGSAVDSAVRLAVRLAVGSAVYSGAIFWHGWMGGQFWQGYLGWAAYMRDELGVETPTLQSYEDTCESGCYWWPNKDFCIACERPVAIHRDERGRLHSTDGLAIEWPDGWGLHMWHGVRLGDNAKAILAGEIPVSEILKERNAEIKRAMIECAGWDKVLMESHAEAVDYYDDQFGRPVTLYRLSIGEATDAMLLHMLNSTPESDGTHKPYTLRVPPTMRTAKESMAWTWGMREGEYAPVHES